MSSHLMNMITLAYFILVTIICIVLFCYVRKKIKKQYVSTLNDLDRNKNLIISGNILSELNKVESLINNKELEEKYNYWKTLFKAIKEEDLPRITDEIIVVEDIFNNRKFKDVNVRLARIEFDIYIAKSKSQKLLKDIEEITLSEQKNREIVTKLKSEYRNIFLHYNNANNKGDYALIEKALELQFENIDKLFSAFEVSMENNIYSEVGKIVKALDDTIGNLKIVIEEAPSIILMGKSLIPVKIKEIQELYNRMISEGYNLEYLKVEYNINESEKKIADVFDRLNVLNLEDSLFELRTILDYFEKLYADFDKEKMSRKLVDENIRVVAIRIKKLKKIINNIFSKLDELKYKYDLTDSEVHIIEVLKKEIEDISSIYDKVLDNYRNKSKSFSHLNKHLENINLRLIKAEDKLDYTLRSLGSLKEDELRAREQLDEIKDIIKQAKKHINSYKLPLVPKNYYVQLEEALEAIKAMSIELDKKPISIKILNTRVDTARDLVLKLFNTSLEIVKTASMAENAIIYGNRYRAINKTLDNGLNKAERDFFKGNFKSSLEYAINSINVIEPGIYERLLSSYEEAKDK